MKLHVLGVSHHSAPLDVREGLAVSGEALLRQLQAVRGACEEAMVLSTCNRYELYVAARDDAQLEAALQVAIGGHGKARAHLYKHEGERALQHLFRVASSLDSLVLGEPQILGQVKDAFEAALQAGAVGPLLQRTVQRALQVAKRVRTETRIGENAASVASVAVSLAGHIFGDGGSLAHHPVLVVGAGKMAELAARHLKQAEVRELHVVNRTRSRAEELAAKLGGVAHDFSQLESLLARADVVLCGTGAQEPVIRADLVQRVMKARRGRWMLFVDIAVPRDVDPKVGEIDSVYLYDVDALQQVVEENRRERQREAEAAEAIVGEELRRFAEGEREKGVVPTIRSLRERSLAMARREVEKTLPRLSPGASEKDRQLFSQMAEAIVNKMLHGPLTALKRDAAAGPEAAGGGLEQAVRALFQLDEPEPAEQAKGKDSQPAQKQQPTQTSGGAKEANR